MIRKTLLTVALGLLLGPAAGWANNPRLAGTLVQMNTHTGVIVIRTSSGNRTIQLQGSAKVERGGATTTLSAFHVGEPIEVVIGGTLSNSPLIGMAVYDNATAAALPPPSAPQGVYGIEKTDTIGLGGIHGTQVSTRQFSSAMESLAMGNPIENTNALQNQPDPNFQGAPTVAQVNQQNQPTSMDGQPAPGWSNTAPGTTTPASNPGAAVQGQGWSGGGSGPQSTVQGVIRNVDPANYCIYVSTTGGVVQVRLNSSTDIKSAQGTAALKDLQPGVPVQVSGSSFGNVLIVSSILITR